MTSLVARIALAVAIALSVASCSPSNSYSSPQEAQQHCPNDTVVWLNTSSGIYHFQGQRWYGNTVNGAYMCEQDADKAGDRATRNGQ